MNITEITKEAGSDRKRRRVGRGRGSGSGKTCGRGHKGAGQRSGSSRFTMKEGGQMPTFRRLPKRGFSNALFKTRFSVVNVEALERFEPDTHVTPQVLKESGLIRNTRIPVKVLGQGALSKKLKIDAAKFSKSAREKIESAGGSCNEVTG